MTSAPPVGEEAGAPRVVAGQERPPELGRSLSLRTRRQGLAVSDLVIPGKGLAHSPASQATGGQGLTQSQAQAPFSSPDTSAPANGPPEPDAGGASLEERRLRTWAEAHGLEGPGSDRLWESAVVSARELPRAGSGGDSATGDPPPSARLGRLWRSLTRRTSSWVESPGGPKEGSAPPAAEAPSPEKPGAARMQEEERRSAALSPGLAPAERLLLAEGARRLSGLSRMRNRARERNEQAQAHRLDRALHRRALRAHSHPRTGLASPDPGPAVPKTAPAAAWPGGLPRTQSAPSWAPTPHYPMSGPLLWSSDTSADQPTAGPASTPSSEGPSLGRGDGPRGAPAVAAAKKSPLGLPPATAPGPSVEGSEDSVRDGGSGGSPGRSSPSAGSSRDGGTSYATGVSLEPLLRSSSGLFLPWGSASLRDSPDGREGEGGAGAEAGVSPAAWRGLPLEARLHTIDVKQLFLGAEVAAGAFGRIFRGQYKKREVAVKVLRMTASQEAADAMAHQFQNEVGILSQLEHPNIVKFVGAYCCPPVRTLVMEYCRGGSVRHWLRLRRGQLIPPLQLLDMAADIAHAGAYLHSQGIVHRDLKTENLLFTADGTIKLADFGEAVRLGPAGTARGEIGTYRWMAPEVLAGKAYGGAADVYSFALVLWELLTLQLPFPDMTGIQAAFAVVAREARPPVPAHCPPGLARLMTACWAGNPRRRPTFDDVLAMLARAAPELEQEDEGGPRTGRTARCC
ncbi:Protein kinase superfamily protein [Klebsormidium nitens]|uniref:Protein kinase superfamily protein n=1 Tax=Klebsormidium nitens TaxID=105231 RepID=A0A1Y1IDT3_KLENI|nr:Protein kinase superfamily protein [Klebsormidium nitens]|eukprot:GAQ88743.1 Protein kinase superfamily protein [Klebsormidium nitens]